jgi:hypothetical protein
VVEKIQINQMYEVWPGYYFKILGDGTVRILYKKQPIILDVEDYFRRLQNIAKLAEMVEDQPKPLLLEKLPEDKTKLTANEYMKMSIKELEEVIKELEEKEMYEKCAGILQLINYKKETENGESNS